MEALPELILNVDDTDAARYAKTRILRRHGYRVIEAATGAEAVRLAQDELPSLVILDTKLPDISGFDVCRQIKQAPGISKILVLQTSASCVSTPDKVYGIECGADNYLFEPIEPEELVANVKALLRLGKVERKLREVDRRKDEFLAILAHELRNPLGPIRNAVELLRMLDPVVPTRQAAARGVILRQVKQMTRLVDDLLDISRISQGKIDLRCTELRVSDILQSAVETAMPHIMARQHVLNTVPLETELWVHGDMVRLSQAVANLLNNAAKFTPPQGRIEISAFLDNGVAVVRVRDNGIGIEPHQIGRIFDLFAQAGHATDRVQDGLGIGLSLVRTLIELHGGTISVASEGPSTGSVFEVRLPAVAAPSVHVAALEAAELGAATYSILIIDDNADAAEMLSALLSTGGHRVSVVHTGAEGVAAATQQRPDIVIIDIGLPDMNGMQVAQRIRSDTRLADTRLIALTGYGQDSDRARAAGSGFNNYLTKPVGFAALVATFDNHASR
jgi:signal transduction histidine kinase